ncbi:MAG: hypothetical protein ACRD2O_03570 [Terriglobia bacterium]
MNRLITFWIASSSVLFMLSLVYFHYQLHRKNPLFAWWLCLGVTMELISAYAMVLGSHRFLCFLWRAANIASILMAVAVLILAYARRSCPVNRTLLYGLGAMLAFNLVAHLTAGHISMVKQTWLQDIAFFGPALFLLVSFSNIRGDRIPLRICSALRQMTLKASPSPGLALGFRPVSLQGCKALKLGNEAASGFLMPLVGLDQDSTPNFFVPMPPATSRTTGATRTRHESQVFVLAQT